MPITNQPPFADLSAYRPIEWRSFYTQGAPSKIESAVVTAYINGVAVATYRKKPFEAIPVTFPFFEYYFDIDIQEIVQLSLAPFASVKPSIFPVLGSDGNASNTDFYADVNIEISYDLLNGTTGLVEPVPIPPEVSSTHRAFVASRQHEESMSLEEFIHIPFVQDGQPLTRRAIENEICMDENLFMSYIGAFNYIRVFFYDEAGNIVAGDDGGGNPYFGGYNAPILSGTNDQNTTGVGLPNLAAKTYLNGRIPPTSSSDVAYYTVNFGFGLPFLGNIIFFDGIEYTFNIVDCCKTKSVRFHWQNYLGGPDSYTFKGLVTRKYNTSSERAQKTLGWDSTAANPHSVEDFGSFKTQSKAVRFIDVETGFLKNDKANWLKSFLSSPRVVFIEDEGRYIPATIGDVEQEIQVSTGFIQYKFTAELANAEIIARV
jgi:hypothetical protein